MRSEIKICDICKHTCKLLTSDSNPEAAEFYCEDCRRSYPVDGSPSYRTQMEMSKQ